MEYLLALLVLAGIVALVWYSVVQDRKRIQALAGWAADEGWTLDPSERKGPALDYDLFQQGHSRSCRFTAERTLEAVTPGLESARLRLFEYHYAVTHSTGKSTTTHHHYHVCALVDAGLELGRVRLRREGLGDKLVQALGFDDIDLEDPEFSRRYVVQAAERRDAYELLDGPMMRFLCAAPAPSLETRGRELFAYVPQAATARGYRQLAAFTRCLLAQLPRPLVNAERARLGLEPLLEAGNASPASRAALARFEERKT